MRGRGVIRSDASHYSRSSVAGWLGIGMKGAITVPTLADNSIDLGLLAQEARQALRDGKKIAAFIATLGTTDAFGLDDLRGMVALRDRLVEEFQLAYSSPVHADAVMGWAWSVFADYDFKDNPLGFRPRILRALSIRR